MTTKRRKHRRSRSGQSLTRPSELVAQLPAYASELFEPHRYKILYGGRGGARSWTVARALLIKAASGPLRILCTRELQSSIRDSVHLLLRDQITLMGLDGFDVTYNEIRHTNGSVFLFEGLRQNVTKIKSLEGVDICWVEEAERISKDSWRTLIPTIRKEGSEIWITFNPDQEDDATYARFITNTPKRSWKRKVTWEDNPWFPEVLAEERDYDYAVDPDAADHTWGGNTRMISDAQILKGKWKVEEFVPVLAHAIDDHSCEYHVVGKRCLHGWDGPYQGMDFGFSNDPAAAVRLWICGTVLYVEHELWKLHLELDHITKMVQTIIPNFDEYTTRADSARPDSISYLRRHGLPRIVGVKKHPGSIEDGVAHLRSYTQIVIHPRCTHTRDEAKRYSYKVDERSGDILPVIVDAHNHCMDSIRYALEPMIKPKRNVGVFFPVAAPAIIGNGDGHAAPPPRLLSTLGSLNRR